MSLWVIYVRKSGGHSGHSGAKDTEQGPEAINLWVSGEFMNQPPAPAAAIRILIEQPFHARLLRKRRKQDRTALGMRQGNLSARGVP